jgi:hypothetical protein
VPAHHDLFRIEAKQEGAAALMRWSSSVQYNVVTPPPETPVMPTP